MWHVCLEGLKDVGSLCYGWRAEADVAWEGRTRFHPGIVFGCAAGIQTGSYSAGQHVSRHQAPDALMSVCSRVELPFAKQAICCRCQKLLKISAPRTFWLGLPLRLHIAMTASCTLSLCLLMVFFVVMYTFKPLALYPMPEQQRIGRLCLEYCAVAS